MALNMLVNNTHISLYELTQTSSGYDVTINTEAPTKPC